MVRKPLALAAVLGMVIAFTVTTSADADPLDQAVANVNGGVNLDFDGDTRANADGDFDGDIECTGALQDQNPGTDSNDSGDIPDPDVPGNGTCDDDPHESCTVAGGPFAGDAGDRAQFTDVQISGTFSAFNEVTSVASAWAGTLTVGDVNVCVHDEVTTHDTNGDGDPDNDGNGNGTNDVFDPDGDGNGDIPPIPLMAGGTLEGAPFSTVGVGVDLVNGGDACIFGELVPGGVFTNTGAATSTAIIHANWSIRRPDGAGQPCDTEGGAFLAETDGNVRLRADVAVVPAGLATNGSLPDVVSAQVHNDVP